MSDVTIASITGSEVHDLLSAWWYAYDQGKFSDWPAFFTSDLVYSSRGDDDSHALAEFVKAEATGREAFCEMQEEHRLDSPYPLRHLLSNVHVHTRSETGAEFRSYLLITQVTDGTVNALVTGRCIGDVRREEGALRIARLDVVLDLADSTAMGAAGVLHEALGDRQGATQTEGAS